MTVIVVLILNGCFRDIDNIYMFIALQLSSVVYWWFSLVRLFPNLFLESIAKPRIMVSVSTKDSAIYKPLTWNKKQIYLICLA